jgi:hypothetical protein
MPSKDGLRLSPTTARDGLFFNAFEDSELTTIASRSPVMTPTWQEEVVKTPRKGKLRLKRRGSDTIPSSSSRNCELRVSARPLGHSRSQTEQSCASSYDPHPLGSTTIGSDAFAGHPSSTRPHLSRIMSAWESPTVSDAEGERKGSSSDAGSLEAAPAVKDDEKTVLVHEVSPQLLCGISGF